MPVTLSFKGPHGQVAINRRTCAACGACAAVCMGGTLVKRNGHVEIRSDPPMLCAGCGACVAACPTGSIAVTGRGMTGDDACDLPPPEQRATADQLRALLLARRSVRHYAVREVERSVIERVIDMATMAPMGFPPHDVSVVVFNGRPRVRQLAADTIQSASAAMPWLRGPVQWMLRLRRRRYDLALMRDFVVPFIDQAIVAHQGGEDMLMYDAPAALLFHYSPAADPADPVIVATYAMLAAESLGLGTCLIGSVCPFVERNRAWRRRHGIPAQNKLGLVLIMGHPLRRPKRALRRRLASVAWA